MAAINTLGVDHLSLRGTGDEYNRFSRYFKTRAEAEAALASGDWTPVAGVANACLTNDEGVLAYDQATNTLVNADEATREYINTQITNLVGDAPAVLDQLGELSDALGDDANFITTINDRITTESARVDSLIATDMWLFADQASFPDAGFNHGRVVHSHADGAMFYAHGGMWHKIENEAEAEAARAAIQADVDLNQGNVEAAIAALQGDVNKIELDSDAAEAALSGRLDVLEADPTTATALAAVQSDVDQNEAAADAADAALGVRIDAVEAEIDTARTNIYTALGQTEGATAMGTFTGSTLGDGQTIKQLLQTLETATEGEISARTAVAEFVSNITKLKNDLRGTYLNLGNNIELRPAAGGRVEITGDLRLDNNSDLINGSDTVLTSFESINTFDGRITVLEADPVTKSYVDGSTSAEAAARVASDEALDTRLDVLEADPTTAAAVAAVQADVDQNEADADAAIAVERGRIDAILDAADADKDSFAEIVNLINSVDTTNDDAFAAYVLSNDAAVATERGRIDAVETEIDTARTNIYSALGQSEGATAMGTFTGSTLGDGQTIKQLLQTLETATETEISDRQAAIADILDGATFTGDILFGTLARLQESGNEFKIRNDSQSSSIVVGPKISLQPATGSRIELFETVRMPDGTDLTVTGAELNFVDGVTSNIQTQLDAIQADVDQNETDGDAAIAVERGRIDAILDAVDADKDSFAEIVNLINSVDTENDNAFAGYVTSNDAALATERGRIDAVETEIDTARTNIYTALGQSEGATAMGTFTGSTLGDGQTVKQLLQTLETATEGETTARTAIAEFVSNLTRIKNDLRGTYINVGNNIELRPAPGGRVEITGDLYLDNNTAIDGNGTILTSFANINAYDGRLNTLEADPTTATAVAAVQADVDQNEADADAAIALKLDASAVSAFGLTLVDDADAAAARTTLGVDAAGTDNSTDVTIAAGRDYVTITDQELTLGAVDLAADVTGVLPVANGGTGASDIPGVKSVLDIDHIHTTLGVAASSDDLGTFDGSTIADNQTVKEALQALETAQEATQADVDQNESDADTAIANILNGTSIPGPYNNDTAAGDDGVAIGAIYKNSNGSIHWRVT